MKRYFAPLEGITNYIFRNAYNKYYGGIDKYFAPFISPADGCPMTPKEKRDIVKENNPYLTVVPQILTCKSRHFCESAVKLKALGYNEINLNLGCPSGTVCTKGKGAGFLTDIEKLEFFLDDIYEFAEKENIKISIKTRVGRNDDNEWIKLQEIYNKFPVYELIIHPRIGVEFYKGKPRMEVFSYAVKNSCNNVVYNGDITSLEKIDTVMKEYPDISAVMIGRGIITNPEMLFRRIDITGDNRSARIDDIEKFRKFHDEIYEGYKEIMKPDINTLHRMKELWTYWINNFPDSDRIKREIIKSKKYSEYNLAVKKLI